MPSKLVKDRYISGIVFMSSVSDAYQPIEKELGLTRTILKNMDKNIKLSILTKPDLVLRDIDLLKKFKDIEIGFTINSFEGEEKDLFEPRSPKNQEKITAMKTLQRAGIRTYTFIAPIIPDLTNVGEVIAGTKDYADYFWLEVMNLRGAGQECTNTIK